MHQAPLPVILSCPHGGLEVPPQVADRLAVDMVALYNDCDLWVDQLFDFGHPDLQAQTAAGPGPGVLAQVTMPIARALIDSNRPPDDLDHPDGAVKSMSSYGVPLYHEPLGQDLKRELLEAYWRPYHQALAEALQLHAGQVKLLLDCHNMAQVGPSAYHKAGALRPLICLGNGGGAQGEPRRGTPHVSCPPWLIRAAAGLAAELFQDLPLLEPEAGIQPPVVAINDPYPGGYILRAYGLGGPMAPPDAPPAMMIEVNRGLFVGNQQADTPMRPPHQERIRAIRERLYRWLLGVLQLLEEGVG